MSRPTALEGRLLDPERPYPFFPDGCPAPLREGISFSELCGACPMQAEGAARGRRFTFYARHGRWEMYKGQRSTSRPGRPGRHHQRILAGVYSAVKRCQGEVGAFRVAAAAAAASISALRDAMAAWAAAASATMAVRVA